MSEPVHPSEGMGVLHLFYRVDRAAARELPASAAKDLEDVLSSIADGDEIQLHLFSALGHKADAMVFALADDLSALRDLQTRVGACEFGAALELTWSYVSLTETSEYTPTVDEERIRLAEQGVEGDDLERRVDKARERFETYNRNKLYPQMPAWEVACFYPMSHRREGDDNWYSLPYDERRRLMHEHGRSGRAFTGRVLQLVTGSTGLDDWEWGVTLFAHDVADLKQIVYRLRYDEASARYGEFGPFVIGLRRTPHELVRDLGLISG
ncbi:MAG: heme-dependent peroxidase [Actinobacteria bacterium]|nr:heme-dependent peroxidase [Actinomycetota bacterium]